MHLKKVVQCFIVNVKREHKLCNENLREYEAEVLKEAQFLHFIIQKFLEKVWAAFTDFKL